MQFISVTNYIYSLLFLYFFYTFKKNSQFIMLHESEEKKLKLTKIKKNNLEDQN